MTEFGLVLSQVRARWEHVVGDARAAEAAGLDSVWLIDHLQAPLQPSDGIFEGWTALAALAGATERVRLGHLVTCVSFRNVGLLAKMAATVDHASGGRLELGLGAGWHEAEYRAFGYEFPTAGQRRRALAEAIDALGLLFTGEPADFHGEFVQLNGAVAAPPPLQLPRPPLTVGASGPLMLELVGRRADAWNVPAALLPDFAQQLARVREAAGDRPVRVTIQVPAAVGRDEPEAAAARQLAAAHLGWMGDPAKVGLMGTVDEARERVDAYRAAGVDGFICVLPGSRLRPDLIAALGELVRACYRPNGHQTTTESGR